MQKPSKYGGFRTFERIDYDSAAEWLADELNLPRSVQGCREFWEKMPGKGIAKEAVLLILDYYFNYLRYHRCGIHILITIRTPSIFMKKWDFKNADNCMKLSSLKVSITIQCFMK